MKKSDIGNYFVWIGVTVLISSGIFTFYYSSIVLPTSYLSYINNIDSAVTDYCIVSKIDNSSVDLRECSDEIVRMNFDQLSYDYFVVSSFNPETLVLYSLPIVAGILLLLYGIWYKKRF